MPRSQYNLAEAADLVKHDFQSNFLPFLHDWELFERDRETRLADLDERIDGYLAQPFRELPIPKSSLLCRPGALPVIGDWILYTAVTTAIARQIEASLVPVEQEVLFSFRWNEENPAEMIKGRVSDYSGFRQKSLRLLDEYPFALETDITSYFEHIDFKILRAVLLRLGATREDVEYLIQSLVRRWTHRSARGIPQGPWASSYLGNVYLDSVDKGMLLRGYTFARYADDMRIFCHNVTEARRAILDLSDLTRELGLSIQAAKTQIHNREGAREAWRGYAAWLQEVQQAELREVLQDYLAGWGPYGETNEIEPLAAEIEQEGLQGLFDLITRERAYKVDRKGLTFALSKFGENRSEYAVNYCLDHLADLPHVAPACSEYLALFVNTEDVQHRIFRFVSSPECVYDWQAMYLLRATLGAAALSQELLRLSFGIALDRNRDIGVRSTSIDLLARHGTNDQVRELCRFFTREVCEEVRATIILASHRLQQVERRNFLGACRGCSSMLDSAVTLAW